MLPTAELRGGGRGLGGSSWTECGVGQTENEGKWRFSFGEEKLVAPLIATPSVDNTNKRQEKGKKLANHKLCVIRMQKGILFIFANYLDEVLVRNHIGEFKKGEWRGRLLFPPFFMS
jgi:hypothetical protein